MSQASQPGATAVAPAPAAPPAAAGPPAVADAPAAAPARRSPDPRTRRSASGCSPSR